MSFFNTFRGRLLLILAFLLVATLGIQYYLNLLTQQENNNLRQMQEQALVAGITLGFTTIPLRDTRVQDLLNQNDQTFFDERTKERIRDIIIIDSKWRVIDSLNPAYLPVVNDNDEVIYKQLIELTDLPPLMEGQAPRRGPQEFSEQAERRPTARMTTRPTPYRSKPTRAAIT